ncbi:MAG: hypothetical protein ABI612_17860 [Betaproteobacteria bacterium]
MFRKDLASGEMPAIYLGNAAARLLAGTNHHGTIDVTQQCAATL